MLYLGSGVENIIFKVITHFSLFTRQSVIARSVLRISLKVNYVLRSQLYSADKIGRSSNTRMWFSINIAGTKSVVSSGRSVYDCVSTRRSLWLCLSNKTQRTECTSTPLHSTPLLGVLPAYLIVVTEIEQSSSLCIYTSLSILLYSSGSCNARWSSSL